ncbi:MAG: carbohydrate porin [Bacteroidetes bacterium]|nr:carbohydrate porin [Bacteroidota bacterium]
MLLQLCTTALLHAQDDTTSSPIDVHFQMTTVTQYHPAFSAAYSGANSMSDSSEGATSLTTTFFFTWHVSPNILVRFDPELAGGAGLSRALGAAGFPNGETFRVGDPTPQAYVARLYAQFLLQPSTDDEVRITAGKFSLSDFFDNNAFSHDPHGQFLNWSFMSNGAWDYAANTRGYTVGLVVEYERGPFAARISSALVPKTANGPDLEWDLSRGHSETAELQFRYDDDVTPGTIRILGYLTHANMGSYTQAVAEAPTDLPPSVVSTRQVGRTKYGVGVNIEQALNPWLGLFARAGWNDGANETWAFTEIDQTATIGLLADGTKWGRKLDNVGVAVAVNGISEAHRTYLARGGLGFMVGDGALTYSPEIMSEVYYRIHMHDQHFWVTPTYQLLMHPGFNADRGPVHILSIRVHVEF